jgi:hypothetical protein
METIDIVLWIALGIFIGVLAFYLVLKLAVHILVQRISKDIETLEAAIEQQQQSIQARVELHDNEFFVYNNDTNEFMAQGSTLQELRDRIKTRWSSYRVSVVAGEDHVLEQLKEQLNESSRSQ